MTFWSFKSVKNVQTSKFTFEIHFDFENSKPCLLDHINRFIYNWKILTFKSTANTRSQYITMVWFTKFKTVLIAEIFTFLPFKSCFFKVSRWRMVSVKTMGRKIDFVRNLMALRIINLSLHWRINLQNRLHISSLLSFFSFTPSIEIKIYQKFLPWKTFCTCRPI